MQMPGLITWVIQVRVAIADGALDDGHSGTQVGRDGTLDDLVGVHGRSFGVMECTEYSAKWVRIWAVYVLILAIKQPK